MVWIYHILPRGSWAGGDLTPASLAAEGFVHGSYQHAVAESARLYFPAGVALDVLQIDPRRLDVPVEVAATPRGPMPHIWGRIPAAAIVAVLELEHFARAPAQIEGSEQD